MATFKANADGFLADIFIPTYQSVIINQYFIAFTLFNSYENFLFTQNNLTLES